MSTMPPTALLLVNSGVVQGHFSSYTEVGQFLGVSIDDDGVITFMDKKMQPSYVLESSDFANNGFTKGAAITDWCRTYMQRKLSIDWVIYRYLR